MITKQFGVKLTNTENLSGVKEGQIVIIHTINAGRKAHRFLADLGIHEGEKIRVIKNDTGPIIVEVRGTRVALGRGLVSKIEVLLERAK